MRVLRADAGGPVAGVEGFGDGAVDCEGRGEGVSGVGSCGGGGEERERRGEREKGREREGEREKRGERERERGGEGRTIPKGRWIWTPLTRSFLVYLGTGMFGDGCGEECSGGNVGGSKYKTEC